MDGHSLAVPRTARYFTLGSAAAGGEVWFVLHGYGQLADAFLGSFEALATDTRLIVAPEALARFYLRSGTGTVGASWMTRERREDEIGDYVRYLDALLQHVVPRGARVHVLGFSQGAATAARWAALGKPRIERLILWGAGLPPDLDLESARERLAALELVLVAGERDENVDLEREARRLHAARLEHLVLRFDGAHEIDQPTLLRLAGSP